MQTKNFKKVDSEFWLIIHAAAASNDNEGDDNDDNDDDGDDNKGEHDGGVKFSDDRTTDRPSPLIFI